MLVEFNKEGLQGGGAAQILRAWDHSSDCSNTAAGRSGGGRDPTINPCPQFSLQGFCVLGFLVSCLLLEGKGQRDAASVAVAALKGSNEEELSFN